MADQPFPLLTKSEIEALDERAHTHQFNPSAVRNTKPLSDLLGLSQLGVHLVRLEPGFDSTQFHSHHQDEEFIYIIEGSATAEIGDEKHIVSAGDFMAFSQNSLPHNMHNDTEHDLVYLMGGTRSAIDICDYPRIGRRMYRVDGSKQYLSLDQLHDVD